MWGDLQAAQPFAYRHWKFAPATSEEKAKRALRWWIRRRGRSFRKVLGGLATLTEEAGRGLIVNEFFELTLKQSVGWVQSM